MLMKLVVLAFVLSFAMFLGALALQSSDACLAATGQRHIRPAGLSESQIVHSCMVLRGGAVKRKHTKLKHAHKSKSSKNTLVRYGFAVATSTSVLCKCYYTCRA
jgi:hypothetical protein